MAQKIVPFQKYDSQPITFSGKYHRDRHFRYDILPYIIIILFFGLAARLFQLTVVKGTYYRFLAENNRIKEIPIEAQRGVIVDRKGFQIAYSQKENDINIKRVYPLTDAASHLVGFRQLANDHDLKNDACANKLKLNDKIGKSGIEQIFECDLRGRKGKRLIEVNAQGKIRKIISQTDPIPGHKIQLSIDNYLQQKAYSILTSETIINSGGIVVLKEKKAAIIASKPNGEILALMSFPSFNPQIFENNNQEAIKKYMADPEKPLFNRALEGTYPPGSVFKLILAAGALQENKIDENFTVEDTGVITAGPLKFGNWYFLKYGKTEGMVDLIKGLRRSNDIFFYRVGEKLGPVGIKYWAEKFGYGKKTESKLSDKPGLIPSDFWKKEILHERWYLGDTYNLSIGQGYLLATPLQVNMATAAVVNHGQLCTPLLLKNQKSSCHSLGVSEKNINLILEGMKQACLTGGTGWPFFDFRVKNNVIANEVKQSQTNDAATNSSQLQPIQVGCKTGTAESHLESRLPHAWFTIFAPYDNPEIIVTVMVEESGEGSNVAAPIAKEILKAYFERKE
ncbi:hypothetical protein A3C23_04555 [Candidatus Roizmanbacteria bacterium RIFCSPHIGHO2_02_FULL_37_13b]|uniref:Penicillin-binding protein 2 n=1 Tax=Candidatus Roizmanbacteria bacterium RIFCSPLOWO2_02_FULL_36_11 TaxID=1802071 RepID=A0A1F7JH91_9BACT|nr:MAG: hypothetical protein A3C23_04555 [Candidatus Roizmanbacteria bacterium RIFCSPHIGHO2_02_FULL_37_13b]OGK54979.1 MAG: hypothetical protein A3H78_00700 [Candidatus Roizmanbacteria bacterium RIFCSPLOWO2_02_FULL_36_11]